LYDLYDAVTCYELPKLRFAEYSFTIKGGGRRIGDSRTLVCDSSEYYTSGIKNITCLNNGEWSPITLRCTSMSIACYSVDLSISIYIYSLYSFFSHKAQSILYNNKLVFVYITCIEGH